MKIKTLLLGSAAVMVAVSGARAADAIIIEPEPVEYVRVCDAYGAGWWYIPGTETCIKFNGDVRLQYETTSYHDDIADEDETSHHNADYRARLNVRAKNETEYGTLSSRIQFQAAAGNGGHDDTLSVKEGPGAANTVVNKAVISLSGFNMGYDEDAYTRIGGSGYFNARYDGKKKGSGDALFIEYTYAANGFAATFGAQDGNASGEAGAPDVYAGVSYSAGGLYLSGFVVQDGSADDLAYRFRGEYDLSSIAPSLKVGGWYASDDGKTDYQKGHIWAATAKMNLLDNLVLFGGYSDYNDEFNALPANNGTSTVTTFGLTWKPVSGLLIQPEYTINTYENENGSSRRNHGEFGLRIVRSF